MSKGSINLPIVSKFDPTGLRNAQTAIGKFGGALKNIGIAAFATASATAIAGIGVAVTKGFGRLQQIENARNLLQGVGNDAATVEKIMDSALAAVKGTAFGMGDAAQVAATASAAGVEAGEQLTNYLKLVADVASVTSSPLNEIGDIFNKITTSGRAQNDTLKQLAERGIPVYQLLADQLGVTADEVFNLARDGKISADILQEALETQLSGAALKAGETVEGAFANVGAAISRIGANLLEGSYNQLPGFFQGLIEILEPLEGVAKDVGKEFSTAMEPVFESILDILPDLIQGLMPIVSLFGTLASTVLPPLMNAFGALAPIVGKIAELFADALVQVMPIVVNLMERLIPIVVMVFDAILPIIEMALPIFIDLLEIFIDVVMPIIEGILPIFMSLFKTLVPIILNVIAAFMPLIKELLPLFMLGLEIAFPVIQFFADLLGVVLPAAFDLLQSLGLIPSAEAFGFWVNGISTLVGGFRRFMIAGINGLIELLVGAANSFIRTVNRILDQGRKIPGALGDIYRRINNLSEITFTPLSIDTPDLSSFLQTARDEAGRVNTSSLSGVLAASQASRTSFSGTNTTSLSGIQQMSGGQYFTIGGAEYFRAFAEGGIVKRATMGLVGEAGPEAIIPLDRWDGLHGGGATYNITVNAGMGTNGTEVGREIVAAIKRYERSSGRVFASA